MKNLPILIFLFLLIPAIAFAHGDEPVITEETNNNPTFELLELFIFTLIGSTLLLLVLYRVGIKDVKFLIKLFLIGTAFLIFDYSYIKYTETI